MKKLMNKYQILILAIMLTSCASQHDESKAYAPDFEKSEQEASFKADEFIQEEALANGNVTIPNKWKKKAEQQLEALEDLSKILKDSMLDIEFRATIQEEIIKIYPSIESNQYIKTQEKLKFRHFRITDNSNLDTLHIDFKNKKDKLRATFTIKSIEKQFGKSSEVVEELELNTIRVN